MKSLSQDMKNVNTINKYREIYKYHKKNPEDKQFAEEYYSELSVYKIAAKEIDLAIVNEEYFNAQVSQDMFEDISTIDGFENLNIPEELLVKASDSNDTEGIYGIKIDSLNLLKKIDFPSKDNILTIIVNSERKEHAMDVLNVLTK